MEVPSPAAGKVAAIAVKEGDSVSEGSVVLTLEVEGAGDASDDDASARTVSFPAGSLLDAIEFTLRP